MSSETQRRGKITFLMSNWTAFCGMILATIAVMGAISTVVWAVWAQDQVDARIDKKLLPIEANIASIATYIPAIEEALIKNAAEHQAIMTASQRMKSDQIYQNMHKANIRLTK